jgi:HD superfamily phosphohydrolase
MYWQVYLHKTAVAAEKMMINTLRRARLLSLQGEQLFASPSLSYFLQNDPHLDDFKDDGEALTRFMELDDNDIWTALKVWSSHPDTVLSVLSEAMINRRLFRIEISEQPFDEERAEVLQKRFAEKYRISQQEAACFISSDNLSTDMYSEKDDSIDILYKDGSVKDISRASDMLNIELLSKKVVKYYFAYLRE